MYSYILISQIKIKPVRGYRNVGTHERELMYFRDHIQAIGYVYKAIPLLIGKDESENIILSLRNRLRLKIQDALGSNLLWALFWLLL